MVNLLPSIHKSYSLLYGSVKEQNYVSINSQVCLPAVLAIGAAAKQNSVLGGAACCRLQQLEMKREYSLELDHLPRKLCSLVATAQMHEGLTEGNKSLSEVMRRDRHEELFPLLRLSSVRMLSVTRRHLKSVL